jgi:hypothetical protein
LDAFDLQKGTPEEAQTLKLLVPSVIGDENSELKPLGELLAQTRKQQPQTPWNENYEGTREQYLNQSVEHSKQENTERGEREKLLAWAIENLPRSYGLKLSRVWTPGAWEITYDHGCRCSMGHRQVEETVGEPQALSKITYENGDVKWYTHPANLNLNLTLNKLEEEKEQTKQRMLAESREYVLAQLKEKDEQSGERATSINLPWEETFDVELLELEALENNVTYHQWERRKNLQEAKITNLKNTLNELTGETLEEALETLGKQLYNSDRRTLVDLRRKAEGNYRTSLQDNKINQLSEKEGQALLGTLSN